MIIDLNLCKSFSETLTALPSSVQSQIKDFWRKQGVSVHAGEPVPAVCKVAALRLDSTCASTDGVFFFFKSTVVEQAPEDILKSCIAHELAHAYRAAQFGKPLDQAIAMGYTSHDQEEKEANKLMAEWGFDRCKLLNWLGENQEKLHL